MRNERKGNCELEHNNVYHLQKNITHLQEELSALKSLISGDPLSEILSRYARLIESLNSSFACSILLYDYHETYFQLGASPSLPGIFNTKLGEFTALFLSIIKNHLNGTNCIHLEDLSILESDPYIELLGEYKIKGKLICPVFSEQQTILGLVFIYIKDELKSGGYRDYELQDIIENLAFVLNYNRSNKGVLNLAYNDSLTSLPNRSLFLIELEKRLNKIKGQKKLVLLYLDCDQFKMINDLFGQIVGDSLLKEIGRTLQNGLFPKCFVSRVGGDDFIIILEEGETEETFEQKISQIKTTFNRPLYINGQPIFLTVSIGVAIYPKDGVDPSELLKGVEIALQQAKSEGRGKICYFQPNKGNPSRRLSLENDIYKALERNELTLFYQPQISIVDGKVKGAEALLRWNHPVYGLISPDEFIPILEETGLIVPVGEWLIENACVQRERWADMGVPIDISVNISPIQFDSDLLINAVNQAITKSGIVPKNLKLEITETLLIKNVSETLEILNKLKHVGIGVSIDDFGTGYSSLSYLKKFPVETIKIDRSFIHNIEKDRHDQAIVKAIIEMGQSLNLQLIAEGTENLKQIRILKEIGCKNIQGFYFSKPVPPEEFEHHMPVWGQLAERVQTIDQDL